MSERVILNGRDDAKTGETAKATATATDLMNRLNRIMTSLKADHIQAREAPSHREAYAVVTHPRFCFL